MTISTFFAQTFHFDLGRRPEAEELVRAEVAKKLAGFKSLHTREQRRELAKLVPEHEFQGQDVETPAIED
jgi:hypothetical protein